MRSSEPAAQIDPSSEIDLRALGEAISRRRRAILVPTVLAFLAVGAFVTLTTPRYTAETQLLLENQETFFTRPDRVNLPVEQANQVDQEAVASQVQLINSRDIARKAIAQLHLAGDSEFDPLAGGLNPVSRVLVMLGVTQDPTRETADNRIVTKFLEKLTVFSPPKTRVITIQFTSRNPELAAKAANTVAQLYLQGQSAAKRATAERSADALAAQIADLRTKLTTADDEREAYRLQSGLLAGNNNMTISGQQLADINSELSKARTSQADAQAKASMIRELIRAGKAADVTDVINNDIVRRVSDQRVLAQAQLAREARTLLPGHPRIKELTAQLSEYDLALKTAAKQAATTLENESRIAGQRVANLESVLSQQKKVAGVANVDEVHLRALERVSQSLKDQLDSSTAKYQEALARQSSTATPSDARVISVAAQPQEPSFPKKIPFMIFGTIATFVFALGYVVASELLSGRATPVAMPNRATGPSRMPSSSTPPGSNPVPSSARLVARQSRSGWAFPEPKSAVDDANVDDEHDLVFAPVAAEAPAARAGGTGVVARVLDYLKAFGRSADQSRPPAENMSAGPRPEPGIGWDEEETAVPERKPIAADLDRSAPNGLVDTIVASHVPGRGLHIVGTGVDVDKGADAIVDLSRHLSSRGRAILVDLNRSPVSLAALVSEKDGQRDIARLHGLAELLSGERSFAEVIHRDTGSRLHYIPTGLQEADFRDFDLILDALSETYDFIVMLTPAFPESEIAKIMAPYADFVVLAVTPATDPRSIVDLEGELVAAGAKDVLVAGRGTTGTRRDVA